MTKENPYYKQLQQMDTMGFIDPLEDLGEFDVHRFQFILPVSQLRNKYSGRPYSPYWQKKIQEMRKVYILYQKSLRNHSTSSERVGYIRSAKDKQQMSKVISIYLSLGFRFKKIAEFVSYSKEWMRNEWKRSEYNQTSSCIVFSKQELANGRYKSGKYLLERIAYHE